MKFKKSSGMRFQGLLGSRRNGLLHLTANKRIRLLSIKWLLISKITRIVTRKQSNLKNIQRLTGSYPSLLIKPTTTTANKRWKVGQLVTTGSPSQARMPNLKMSMRGLTADHFQLILIILSRFKANKKRLTGSWCSLILTRWKKPLNSTPVRIWFLIWVVWCPLPK